MSHQNYPSRFIRLGALFPLLLLMIVALILAVEYVGAAGSPAPQTATVSILFDETASGTISNPTQKAQFTFNGSSGDWILVRLTATSGNLDPEFELREPGSGLVCGASTVFASLEQLCQLNKDGTHSIFVSDANSANTGNFDLYIQSIVMPANAQPIALDVHEAASITPGVDMDAYTFEGIPGDRLLVRMTTTSGNLDPQMRVYRPDGTLLCEDSTVFASLEHECLVDTSGTHTIFASDQGGVYTGNFDLYVQSVIAPANSQSIELDVHRSATITPGVDMDAYTFEGIPGDRLLVRMTATSGNLDPQMRVYRPDGTLLCEDSTVFASLEHECLVDTSGTHTIFASDQGGVYTGNFDLYVQSVIAPANSITSGPGILESGSIVPGVDMDAFTLRANSGNTIRVTMTVTSGNLDPQFRMYRPDGTLVCEAESVFSSIEDDCFPDVDGQYVVLISAADGDSTGNYELNMTCIFCPNSVDLHLQMTASSPTVDVGANLTLDLEVINDGPLTATDSTLAFPVPSELTYVQASPTQGTCSFNGEQLDCALGAIGVGDIVAVAVELRGATPGIASCLTRTAAQEMDSDLSNNQAQLSVRVGSTFRLYLPTNLGTP